MARVERRRSGMKRTARRSRGASKRIAVGVSPWAAIVNPPRSAAAALSGWPSSSVASTSARSVVSSSPPSAAPARSPPTTAAADEPSPRLSGIRFVIAIRQLMPSGSIPRASAIPRSRATTNPFDRSAGSSPAPSPSTLSSIPRPGRAIASTSIRSTISSATASVS